MKIRPLGGELLPHAEGQTDRYDEVNSGFLPFLRKHVIKN